MFAPVSSTKGQPSFVADLFSNPIVTRAVITLGTNVLFSFNGTNFTPGQTSDDPTHGKNLVAADDFVYAEPVPLANASTILNGSQGTSAAAATIATTIGATFSGTAATFTDSNSMGLANDFHATINWGDGHLSNGTVKVNSKGGYDVNGSNAYGSAGLFPVTVSVVSYGGSLISLSNTANVALGTTTTTLSTSANPARVGDSVTFMATVKGPSGGAVPSGIVTFLDGSTTLGVGFLDSNGAATFTKSFAPGNPLITAVYGGDSRSARSTSTVLSQGISPDITGLVSITHGKFKLIHKKYYESITLVSKAANPITGPVAFIIDGLNSSVRLVNANGSTTANPPNGSPYITLGLATNVLSPGQSITFNLIFSTRRPRNIAFVPRVLAGLGTF